MIPQLQIGRELSKPRCESGEWHKYTDGTRSAAEVTVQRMWKEKCFSSSPAADGCCSLADTSTWARLATAQLPERASNKSAWTRASHVGVLRAHPGLPSRLCSGHSSHTCTHGGQLSWVWALFEALFVRLGFNWAWKTPWSSPSAKSGAAPQPAARGSRGGQSCPQGPTPLVPEMSIDTPVLISQY